MAMMDNNDESNGNSNTPSDPLQGIGNQGGRIQVDGGGGLKASAGITPNSQSNNNSSNSSRPRPSITIMSIETHVQCRNGRGSNHRDIAMTPDSSRDAVYAIVYIFATDPGGGAAMRIHDRGCMYVPVEAEMAAREGGTAAVTVTAVKRNMGLAPHLTVPVEEVRDETSLLRRIASIVQLKDPDVLTSWDTHGAGIGYLVERGVALGKKKARESSSVVSVGIDLVRLLGRTPSVKSKDSAAAFDDHSADGNLKNDLDSNHDDTNNNKTTPPWKGSTMGTEWDDRVGPGAAASSIIGRIVLCGWKIASEEVHHPNASYQPAICAAVLKKRIPYHDNLALTRWYGRAHGRERWRVLKHRLVQARATLLILDALDVIGRAGEAARLSGVEFSQSFPGIRGSQYKVEGVLLRALQSVWANERGKKKNDAVSSSSLSSSISQSMKSQSQSPWKLRREAAASKNTNGMDGNGNENSNNCNNNNNNNNNNKSDQGYFFLSPSKEDCENIEALECQAMTLEPESGFHYDPVVVCDFTALYPSLIIAYNLCFSTCAGKLEYHSTRRETSSEGRTTGRLGPCLYPEEQTATVLKHHMKSLFLKRSLSSSNETTTPTDRAYAVPSGSVFVSEHVLKGVLPQILDEMLSTRAMIKRAAKEYRKLLPNNASTASILRQLEARQLALKYVANVTYGYTSATFSGRSPMPLLADSIVECGRRTLSNAIDLANQWGSSNEKYKGARVIYGDTDSLFIKLPGRTVEEAFEFGTAFCSAVTAANPPPVQLKLEKVYLPALLQTKKKYCGMKYEHAAQKSPAFEAKGIETVRKDQCVLTQKVLRNALVTLFKTRAVEAVQAYLHRQWSRIHAGQLPVSDFILTGRVRSRYRKSGPVQAALAQRLAEADPGRVVRHKERQPYVIVACPGINFRLKDCVLTPMELLEQWDTYTIHSAYYATKHVNAALQRCFSLPPHKIDVHRWYEVFPKPRKRIHHWPVTRSGGNTMISNYFGSDVCSMCGCKCKAKGSSRVAVCARCRVDEAGTVAFALKRLNLAQLREESAAKVCAACNGCFEHARSFAVEKKCGKQRASSANNNQLGMLGVVRRRRSSSSNGSGLANSLSPSSVASGISIPLANCTCIDCPLTFERHRARENALEAIALCKTLELF